jgi:UDP-2,3-diacylglucosamine hydrolase
MAVDIIPVRSALLVSDIHLNQDTPALTNQFLDWLTRHTTSTNLDSHNRPDSLFILGDLLDAWVGDDYLAACPQDAVSQQLVSALKSIADTGVAVYLMHGNRDFLIGQQFASASDTRIINDPTVLDTGSQRIAITHGDQLCTQDKDYQTFRLQVRDPGWQSAFLAKSLDSRLAIAQALRSQSETEKSNKSMAIMDITPDDAVMLTDQLLADALIHGHTHRPGCTIMANQKPRWVLPDWEIDHKGKLIRGGGLWINSQGIQAVPIIR